MTIDDASARLRDLSGQASPTRHRLSQLSKQERAVDNNARKDREAVTAKFAIDVQLYEQDLSDLQAKAEEYERAAVILSTRTPTTNAPEGTVEYLAALAEWRGLGAS